MYIRDREKNIKIKILFKSNRQHQTYWVCDSDSNLLRYLKCSKTQIN